MPHHKKGAYDRFDHVEEVAEYYKRCRKRKGHILSDEAVNAIEVYCAHCGERIYATDDERNDQPSGGRSNLASYYPRQRALAAKHYYCAWESLMEAIIVHNGVAQGVLHPEAVMLFDDDYRLIVD